MNLPQWRPADQAGELVAHTIDVWRVNLNPPRYDKLKQDISLFSTDELERGQRFRFDRHRRQYLVGRGALRQILSQYCNLQPGKIEFSYGEFGKPFLKESPIAFNLSNSHDQAIIAITLGPRIGADVEFRERHIWDVDALAKSVFTETEQAQLNSYSQKDRLVPFLSGWTRKEAYLKGVGKGLALPLKDFSVDLANAAEYPYISVREWQLKSFWSADDYLAAIAYPASMGSPSFRWFEWTLSHFDKIHRKK